MTTNKFYYVTVLLEQLYGISLPDEQFEEIALVAWNLIGNKRCRLYRYSAYPDSEGRIELPCNADILEGVTYDFEDWNYVTNMTPEGDLNSAYTEHYIEARKEFQDPMYIRGKFVKYEQVGNTLYLQQPHGKVNILYRGIILDDDGLPELTDKEALAIATYCAYTTKFKEGLMTNNGNIIQMANVLKQQWNVQVDQARSPEYLTQNEMDQILDAKSNWNRKIHNKSWKGNR